VSRLVMCGIPRSGSTLVWQIVSEVTGLTIEQTHPLYVRENGWNLRGTKLIITYRDPRDLATSLYRVRLSRGGPGVGGEDGLKCVIHRAKLYFDAARTFRGEGHLFLRYEDFVDDRSVVFAGIKELTGIDVAPDERARIVEKFSLEANRARAARLPDFNVIDKNGIHGDHIGPVVHGSWRSWLPPWGVRMVEDGCAQTAREWAYE
jgi:hypothetical protein